MAGFRAKFINGLGVKPDTKITLTLCVSMNCVQQTGEQFAAFLGLVVKHSAKIENLQIIVSDDLYRHYHGWTPSTSDVDRRAMAESDFSKWVDEDLRYLSFFRDVDNVFADKEKMSISEGEANRIFGLSLAELQCAKAIEFKIIRWRTLVETPEYVAAKAVVDKAFVEMPKFRSVVEEVAKSHCEKRGYALESAIEFLKEEIAATAGPLKEREVAYPSVTLNAAITCALRDIFHEEVSYHGYSIELRGRPFLSTAKIPVDVPDLEGRLRAYMQMLTVAAQGSNARIAEMKVKPDGSMRFRFEYGGSSSREHPQASMPTEFDVVPEAKSPSLSK